MPSASTPPVSLSEACCQRGHQLGTPWGPPTPSCRTFKLSGPGVRLPRTTERQAIALYVHIVVASPCYFHPDPALSDLGWAGGENSEQTLPSPPRPKAPPPWPAQNRQALIPAASIPGLAQLWEGVLKPRGALPGDGVAYLLPVTVTWRPHPPSPAGRQQMGVARLPDLGPPLYTHHQ